ncbi:MAG: peptide chain release factor N(5)-glutamine methyltransferase [Clostridia bacterium]|nr:peptide chain release factor N(5)-glutamine methyltransferase [Clostridia bacterium]
MFRGMTPLRAVQRAAHRVGSGDARMLVCHALNTSVHGLLTRTQPISAEESERIVSLIARLETGTPVQYLMKEADFFGHSFYVDERVLIPRYDSEVLLQAALARLPFEGSLADICTGSGCLAISAALARPDANVFASDISIDALAVAQWNAEKLNAPVRFAQGSALAPWRLRQFDVIMANPPYITAEEMEQLPPSVARFEPHLALYGGPDGLDVYDMIIQDAPTYLWREGWLCLEVSPAVCWDVLAMMEPAFVDLTVVPDNAGRPRAVCGRRS